MLHDPLYLVLGVAGLLASLLVAKFAVAVMLPESHWLCRALDQVTFSFDYSHGDDGGGGSGCGDGGGGD